MVKKSLLLLLILASSLVADVDSNVAADDYYSGLKTALSWTPSPAEDAKATLAYRGAFGSYINYVKQFWGGSGGSSDVNVVQFGGASVVIGTGVSGSGIPRVTVASDSSLTANQGGSWTVSATQSGNWTARLQDGSGNNITSQVSGAQRALDIGINVAGVQVDPRTRSWTLSSGTDSVNIGNYPATQAVTQSGTWTVQPGNTANTTPWLTTISQGGNNATVTAASALKVDGSGVTQPISGSVTSTQGTTPWVNNITQFGSSNVVTGAGAGGAGIPRVTVSNDSNVLATQSGTWTVQPGNTANTTAWKVDGSAVTQPISGAVSQTGGPWTTNVTQFGGTNVSTGTGASGTGIPRVTVANDSNILATQSGNWTIQPLTNSSIVKAQLQDNAGTAVTLGQKTMANSLPIVVASDQTNLPVSVNAIPSFFGSANLTGAGQTATVNTANFGVAQFTVSGTWNATIAIEGSVDAGVTYNGLNSYSVNGFSASSNGQAIVPIPGLTQIRLRCVTYVSGTIVVNVSANSGTSPFIGALQSTNPWIDNITQFGGTNLSTGTGAGGAGIPRVTVSNDSNVLVTPPTLTKGTQSATGFSTQDLKDAGRVALSFYAVAAAAGTTTTETAITLTKSSGTSATTTGTSFVVTNGKRFRITQIFVSTRGNSTATIQTTTFNLRINTAGAVTTSSTPIVLAARSATPATASAYDRAQITIPDGYEILGDGTLQFGITAAATYVTNAPTWDVNIVGFEY